MCGMSFIIIFNTKFHLCVKKKKIKIFGNLFTLMVIFSISFSSRMEMWLVYPFPVMPCIVKTLCIVLATVAHGKQLPLPHPCHFQACISPPYSCPWRVSRQLKVWNVYVVYMWLVGVRSVNMSPRCMSMARGSPPGETPASNVTALWVIVWQSFLVMWYSCDWTHDGFMTQGFLFIYL